MSDFIVEVCEVAEVKPHPNADRLDVIRVKGWEVITQRGTYKVGDRVTYFPPDTIMPKDFITDHGIEKYVKTARDAEGIMRPCRIAACKLRGIPSFGFVIPAKLDAQVGDNMISCYGATKYEPPSTAQVRGGEAMRCPPNFLKYDGPERWQEYGDALVEGEDVVISEKIHGRNCRAALIHTGEGVYEFQGGSHNGCQKEFYDEGSARSCYWAGINDDTKALLSAVSAGRNDVILYGEVYGARMQDMTYGENREQKFRAFDLCINGKYVNYPDFVSLCQKYNVPMVPILYVGPYSREKVLELTDGPTTLCTPDQISSGFKGREGVVVKPTTERTFLKRGGPNRLILKSVSADYLARRGGTEEH